MARAIVLPRAEHLSTEPQLASLAVLEAAANVAILALCAEYPELACDHVDLREPLELRAVQDLIELAQAVDGGIARYRLALAMRHERECEEQELLPF
jgi:hypothetical protein